MKPGLVVREVGGSQGWPRPDASDLTLRAGLKLWGASVRRQVGCAASGHALDAGAMRCTCGVLTRRV